MDYFKNPPEGHRSCRRRDLSDRRRFVSLKPGGSLSLSAGDWLTIATAVIFSFNLTCLGVYTKRFDPIAVTFVQFGVAGVLFIIGALFTEPMPNASWLAPSVVASVLSVPRRHDECPDYAKHRSGSRACLAGVNHHVYGKSVRCHVLRAVLGQDNQWRSLVGFALIFVAVLMSVIRPTKQSLHRN